MLPLLATHTPSVTIPSLLSSTNMFPSQRPVFLNLAFLFLSIYLHVCLSHTPLPLPVSGWSWHQMWQCVNRWLLCRSMSIPVKPAVHSWPQLGVSVEWQLFYFLLSSIKSHETSLSPLHFVSSAFLPSINNASLCAYIGFVLLFHCIHLKDAFIPNMHK